MKLYHLIGGVLVLCLGLAAVIYRIEGLEDWQVVVIKGTGFFGIALGIGVIALVVAQEAGWTKRIGKKKTAPPPVAETELPNDYQRAFDNLGKALDKVGPKQINQEFETQRQELTALVPELKLRITILLRILEGFVKQAEDLVDRHDVVEKAFLAVQGHDQNEIARLSGLLASYDPDLSVLLASQSKDEKFWGELGLFLSGEMGTLQGYVHTYRGYALSMMRQCRVYRQEIAKQEEILQLAKLGTPTYEYNLLLGQAEQKLPQLRLWQSFHDQAESARMIGQSRASHLLPN